MLARRQFLEHRPTTRHPGVALNAPDTFMVLNHGWRPIENKNASTTGHAVTEVDEVVLGVAGRIYIEYKYMPYQWYQIQGAPALCISKIHKYTTHDMQDTVI